MKNLLYLVHRLPYPPNKGDKISSYNLLRYFSSRYRVFLGTFVDDPADRQYLDKVQAYCADICALDLNPSTAKLASLRGLLTGEALTLAYYRNPDLQAWVDRVCADDPPDAVLIYSGAMGQYVPQDLAPQVTTLFEMEDVDSDKWRSYAQTKPWPLNWIYARESRRLLQYERAMAARFDVSVFISPDEAALFRQLAPEVADKVAYRTQGVDSAYHDPALQLPDPYPPDARVLVFCGAMDYWPNADAVTWYANEVLPAVREHAPDVLFAIVGMNPTDEVLRLGQREGVLVTGAVPDVRPYVRHAYAAVLPLRIARGIQNKALEAMALERPVVATPDALTGIIACPEFKPWVGENAAELIAATRGVLDAGVGHDPGGRVCVLRHYNWDANLQRIEQMLESGKVVDGAAPA
jgi:sugar transferase (PEP-CTERM/EpsH1 system associated)